MPYQRLHGNRRGRIARVRNAGGGSRGPGSSLATWIGSSARQEQSSVLRWATRWAALNGDDPLAALPEAVAAIDADHRDRYAVVLDPEWHPP